MKGSTVVLLKVLMRSTSQWNIFRYCKDKKKKGRAIGNAIGMAVLFLMLMAYCIFSCIGFGKMGLTGTIPAVCAITVSLLNFILTIFKTNGYLFGFKEYDMLMSLPFEAKTVAGCKFLYMYMQSLIWDISISVSMLIGYGIYARPKLIVYPVWIVLSLFLPVIPMLAAAFIGFIITKISAGFKKNSIVQTILVFIFVCLVMASRFVIEATVRNDQIQEALEGIDAALGRYLKFYPPAVWFSDAVVSLKVSGMLLLVGVSVLLFEVVFFTVGRSYRQINSKLKSHAASKKYTMGGLKTRSVVASIALKELRRMLGASVYMTNVAVGELMVLLLGVASLFVDLDKVIGEMFAGAPITKEMLYPAIPFIIYFFIGMVATTAVTPSLEGKNYWIVQSLPISKKTLYQGKMLFNMCFVAPFGVFAVICLCISARAPFITTLLEIVLILCLSAFSTAWGCVCGVKHIRLDWENEIEVVKQGPAVAAYLLPNMFLTMALIVLVVVLGMQMNQNLILGILILISGILAALSYKKAVSLK
ncbi:MAG: hypothetical protein K6G81_07405 [Lachnospiraceae bacterium]|nr:hypothetical protein [Lachnospiraceae bacterium]